SDSRVGMMVSRPTTNNACCGVRMEEEPVDSLAWASGCQRKKTNEQARKSFRERPRREAPPSADAPVLARERCPVSLPGRFRKRLRRPPPKGINQIAAARLDLGGGERGWLQ